MPTAKIYGLRSQIEPIREMLADIIHGCVSEGLSFPKEKRLQRFILLDEADFYYGEGRSEKYLVVEIAMFEGRSVATIKGLINMLYDRIPSACGIPRTDIDITIHEIPRYCWGLQGALGDEQNLGYEVKV
jgi:phenylpyruvate tautomerase PptA (4-oxalocrotonate tautomerase family)